MKPEDRGKEGEFEIARILKAFGVQKLRRPDWVFLHPIKQKWYYVEVKNKEPFEPPPDWLQGFPQSQFVKDIHIDAAGLSCIYIVRGKNNDWLAQYANKLDPLKNPPLSLVNENLLWFPLSQFEPLEVFLAKIGMIQHGRT